MSGEIKGTIGYSNSVKERETSISLGYKKTQNTTCFDKATSVGVKLEHKGINKRHNGETFWGLKFIADDTKGELPGRTYDYFTKNECDILNEHIFKEMEKFGYDRETTIQIDTLCFGNLLYNDCSHTDYGYTSKHITSFIKGEYGRKSTLVEEKNTKLENAYKGTLIGSVDVGTAGTASFGGDARILLEDGFSLTNKIGKSVLKNNVSFGAIADLKLTGGAQKGGIQFGTKLNGESSFVTQVSPNTTVGVSGQAYATVTKPATELGAGVNVFGTHKPKNSKVTFYGNISAGLERQNLRIGGFNNLTENVRTIGITAGAQLSKKVSVGAGYTGYFDKINNTRNRQTFSVTGAVNL